ncbi:zinc finger BED domain-containing protein 4-like [Scomber japonicus]|uniref:zinc finger BED domain-containing protein 4-like n=1 Tax=Scomber japonicus TaxID=13676 RepID=UPI002304D450|nr:zinc finger BED domain-containing protein 4-like [Scomber japonicus]
MRGGTKISSFNTSNLISHLRMNHSESYAAFVQQSNEKKQQGQAALKKNTQLTLKESTEKKQKYATDHPRAKAINRKIIECIALDNQPFSIVQDAGFTKLVEFLEPRFTMPNRKYLSDVCLPELYSVVYSHVEKLIADATSISFTTDIWSSSVCQVSMLSLTAQWLDKDFVLKKSVLHSQECRGSHTAEAIASAFEGMFETWTIPKENVHVVVRDNARNMAKATSEFGVPSLPCMAHTLQLAVNGGALSQRSIADALAVGRRVVGHFKHSPLACSRFEDIQKELNMPVKKLQQDVSTRWNSTYYMMQSLVEQKRVLSAYAADYELPTTLTATQWGIMEKMITLLKPFEQLTRDISSAEATAADVIPGVVSLTRLLAKMDESDKGVQTAKHTLLEAVSKRFNGVQTEPLYAIATMVDARYKDRYFDPDKKEEARNMLLKVVDEMASVGNDQQEDAAGASAGDPGQEDQDPPPKRARTGSLQDMYQEILTENDVAKQATTGETASQVHAYLGEATILKTACPFKYWSSTQVRFPALARVARKYLTTPCTSVDSERLFSAVSNVIDEKRNRIHCHNAEMLIFIQKNLPLTNSN